VIVEELVTKLGLEIDSGALSVLSNFTKAVNGGLAGLASVAGGLTAAFVGVVAVTGNAADEIGDVAERLGESAKAIQELKFAAESSEVSFDDLQGGLKFLAKNAYEAANGNKDLAKAFGGIALRDAAGKIRPATELLSDLSGVFKELPDQASRTKKAMELLGKSGGKFTGFLAKGPEYLKEQAAKAAEFGNVMSDELIRSGGEFDDSVRDTRRALEGIRNDFAGPFVQDFADGLKALSKYLVSLRPTIQRVSKAFSDFGKRAAGIARVVAGIGQAIADVFKGTLLEYVFKSADALKLLEALFIGLGVAAVIAAVQTLAAWVLTAAPFILLGVLIGLIVDELYNFIEGNDTLLGDLEKWANVIDPKDSPFLNFLKSAIALLLDLGDPKKWARVGDAFMRLGDLAFKAFQLVGAKITEQIGAAIMAAVEKVPFLKTALTLLGKGVLTAEDATGSRFSANAADTFGLSGGKKQSEVLAQQLNDLVSPAPRQFLDYSPVPAGAAPVTQSVAPTYNISIDASGMDPAALTSHLDKYTAQKNAEALASLPR